MLKWGKIGQKEFRQAGAELCQAQGKIKLANFVSFCLILFGRFGLIDLA